MSKPAPAWLRGPVPGVDPLLQPVAHALLQVAEELPADVKPLSDEQVWTRSGGSAPIGFHVAHLTGSLDRLLTYARGESLTPSQLAALAAEKTIGDARPALATLLESFTTTIERAMEQIRRTPSNVLLEARFVGRARLPSTTLGLLFHAAEHTARHGGQIVTLARVAT